jgi:hypothetical protein
MEQAGIDKINIGTTDFRPLNLKDRNVWGYNANMKQGGGELPIYSDISGNTLEANGYYHNSNKTGAIYNINQKGLQISFNPSKKRHPYNLISTGQDLYEQVRDIQKEANEILKVDILSSNLVRLDLAKNREMSQPVKMYSNGLRYLKGKRADSREQPDSYYIGNKSHMTTFYNKRQALIEANIKFLCPDYFMRGEARYLKKETINRYTGLSKVSDLLETTNEHLEDSYNTYLRKFIFSRVNMGEQMRIDFKSDIELFNRLKNDMPKGYFNYWLQIMSIDTIMANFGSLDNLELFLYEAGENRMSIHRFVKRVRELIHIKGIIDTSRNQITDVALLEEVKFKFVA